LDGRGTGTGGEMAVAGDRPTRRAFLQGAGAASLGLLGACARLPGQPAAAEQPARVGFLAHQTPGNARFDAFVAAFVDELRERGYVQGQNLALELRYSEGHEERLPALAQELVRLPVQVLVAAASPEIVAVRAATNSIPVVMGNSGDPVAQGFVASLARPGGHVTGVTNLARQLSSKRLETLRDTVPGIARVAVLWNPTNPAKPIEFADMQSAAQALDLEILSLEVRAPEDFDAAFAVITRQGADALVPLGDPLTIAQTSRIVAFAAASRLPAVYESQVAAQAGGLMAYGPNELARWRRVAYYVDRLLQGATPADLPVEQPTTFDFIVNLKTAQAMGLTIPQHVLLQATEIIQ
jgi:putative tryptophan/tyrosine transport system substrate-binding protein